MSVNSDIFIIGAGLIGLSTADALCRRGKTVTVIDAAPGPGQGASFCNSGMIHPSQVRPWLDRGLFAESVPSTLEMAIQSRRILKNRMGEMNLMDAARPDGCLQLFDSQFMGEQALENYSDLGIKTDRYHGAWDFLRFALYFPEDSSGNAQAYCQALHADLMRRGVAFQFDQSVTLRSDKSGVIINIGDSEFSASVTILAAGAKTNKLLQPLEIATPVASVPGYALNFDRPDMMLPDIPIMHAETRSALTVFDDHVRLSGTVGEAGPKALLEIWEEIAPEIVSQLGKPIFSWRGERPMSSLGRPIIDETPVKGLWVNTGHGHMGWTLCAGSGEHMAALMAGEHDTNPFHWVD